MRIGLDVDEVLLQLHACWLEPYNKDYNDNLTVEGFDTWNIHEIVKPECGKKIFDYLTSEMYEHDLVKPYPLARVAVGQLRMMGHRIAFVTSCGPNNEMAEAKKQYLVRHGFLKRDDLFIPGKDKSNAPVDLLVDDYHENVNTFNGQAVLINRPHNLREQTFRMRFNSLIQFSEYLYMI